MIIQKEARELVSRMLGELEFGRTESAVRINSVGSGLAEEDLQVICQADRLPPTIMLPKVDLPDELTWVNIIFITKPLIDTSNTSS